MNRAQARREGDEQQQRTHLPKSHNGIRLRRAHRGAGHVETPRRTDPYRVIQTLQAAQGSRNMGLDPTNHRVFIAAAKFGLPPAGATGSRARRPVLPGSFSLLVVERKTAR